MSYEMANDVPCHTRNGTSRKNSVVLYYENTICHTWIECDTETHVSYGAFKMMFEVAQLVVVQALQYHNKLSKSFSR